MGLLLATILALQTQGGGLPPNVVGAGPVQSPEYLAKRAAANNKFRKLMNGAKTMSVQLEIKQIGNPVVGHAVLILDQAHKLYYHLSWGNDDYTFTILNGEAIEIDKGQRLY